MFELKEESITRSIINNKYELIMIPAFRGLGLGGIYETRQILIPNSKYYSLYSELHPNPDDLPNDYIGKLHINVNPERTAGGSLFAEKFLHLLSENTLIGFGDYIFNEIKRSVVFVSRNYGTDYIGNANSVYKKIIATNDDQLNCRINMNIKYRFNNDSDDFPTPILSKSFIQKFVNEYNKNYNKNEKST